MIGFLGESIKNKFPYWSKVRTDPSSYGASLLDILGSSLEEVRTNGIRAKEKHLVKNLFLKILIYKSSIF